MVFVLPDSKGSIDKILFHHTAFHRYGKQVQRGLFKSFLENLNKASAIPEIYVIATYRNDSEKAFLEDEAKDWRSAAKSLAYENVQVDAGIWGKLPYAQDTCIVLNSEKPSAMITKSPRYSKMQTFFSKVESLLHNAGLEISRPEQNYNLEGGYIYACSQILLYSNADDREMLEAFEQEPIFVDDFVSRLTEEISSILFPGLASYSLPTHIDLMFSAFEKEDVCHVFYVDFREAILSDPSFSNRQHVLLERRLHELDEKLEEIKKRIQKHQKNVVFHKVPGIIGFERAPELDTRLYVANTVFVYSGANLLFHSGKKDYAFYLKFPDEENPLGHQINDEIESALKDADLAPIAIHGSDEALNIFEIQNSAGLRCLMKVLSRTEKD